MSKVTVLGCGSWGTALATVLAAKGQPVTMWCRRSEQAEEMNRTKENKRYLPGVMLPEGIAVTTDLTAALQDTDYVVLAVPVPILTGNAGEHKNAAARKSCAD